MCDSFINCYNQESRAGSKYSLGIFPLSEGTLNGNIKLKTSHVLNSPMANSIGIRPCELGGFFICQNMFRIMLYEPAKGLINRSFDSILI